MPDPIGSSGRPQQPAGPRSVPEATKRPAQRRHLTSTQPPQASTATPTTDRTEHQSRSQTPHAQRSRGPTPSPPSGVAAQRASADHPVTITVIRGKVRVKPPSEPFRDMRPDDVVRGNWSVQTDEESEAVVSFGRQKETLHLHPRSMAIIHPPSPARRGPHPRIELNQPEVSRGLEALRGPPAPAKREEPNS